MRKILILILVGVGMISCGVSKTVIQSKKTIKGDWVLNTITYNTPGNYNVTLLNDVSKSCFEGSTWHFTPNNFTGNYNINKSSCATGMRYFRFAIQEIDKDTGLYDFMLKPTTEKYKSDDNKGFRLQLTNLSDTSMQWKQTITVEGAPFVISMNFSKSNK